MPSQALREASIRCLVCTLSIISRVFKSRAFKYKGIFCSDFFLPIFINISDGAGCNILVNQVEFGGYIKKLFLFQ